MKYYSKNIQMIFPKSQIYKESIFNRLVRSIFKIMKDQLLIKVLRIFDLILK